MNDDEELLSMPGGAAADSHAAELGQLRARVVELEQELRDLQARSVDEPARGTGIWAGPSGTLYALDGRLGDVTDVQHWNRYDRAILQAVLLYLVEVLEHTAAVEADARRTLLKARSAM